MFPAVAASHPVLQKVYQNFSKVASIKADITQIVYEKKIEKQYRGIYQASSDGRFRVDYYSPERQVLICGKNRIEWYYPAEKILYILNRKHAGSLDTLRKLQGPGSKMLQKSIKVKYLGKHLIGFFVSAHLFSIKNRKDATTTLLWIDAKKYVILKRIVKNKSGYEIVKETYSRYKKIKNIYIPSKVNVLTRTKSGTTQNITLYKAIILNKKIHAAIYKINYPKNINVRNLQ